MLTDHFCHQKRVKKAAKKPRKNDKPAESDGEISTEQESDGKSAINKVRAKARAAPGRRGPKNLTLQHWHTPVAIVEPGTIPNRWQFKCKHCDRLVNCSNNATAVVLTSMKFSLGPALSLVSLNATHLKTRFLRRLSGISLLTQGPMTKRSRMMRRPRMGALRNSRRPRHRSITGTPPEVQS